MAAPWLGCTWATRDLDLFWHGLSALPDLAPALGALTTAGFQVHVLRRTPTFVELRVADGSEVTVVDLVADPVPLTEEPVELLLEDVTIQVDTRHEILVCKLTALLSRSELRDLVDLRALLETGEDLTRGLQDAALKDSGFSAATLGWVLQSLPIQALGRANGLPADAVGTLVRFRDDLTRRLAGLSRPPTE